MKKSYQTYHQSKYSEFDLVILYRYRRPSPAILVHEAIARLGWEQFNKLKYLGMIKVIYHEPLQPSKQLVFSNEKEYYRGLLSSPGGTEQEQQPDGLMKTELEESDAVTVTDDATVRSLPWKGDQSSIY